MKRLIKASIVSLVAVAFLAGPADGLVLKPEGENLNLGNLKLGLVE